VIALVVAGGLSDFLGRRPVIIGALAVEVVAMLLFVFAPNIEWIVVARIVQGLATGAATSAFSAAILELAPNRHRKLGALFGSLAPAGGLALGVIAGGIAAQLSSTPVAITFTLIAVVMMLAALVTVFSAETVVRRPGALASLAPRVSMPRPARGEFAAAIPMLVASWMLAGLYLGLVPSLNRAVFAIESGLVDGATSAIEPAAAAIIGLVLGARLSARSTAVFGGVAVLLGTAIILLGLLLPLYPLLLVGGVVGGTGFGSVFSGSLRLITPLVAAGERAEAFSAVYLVSYLAFGIPAIVSGLLIAPLGLEPVAIGYVLGIVIFTVIGLTAQARLTRRLDAVPA
jgi:predicted MFS family arabinose efflux permease